MMHSILTAVAVLAATVTAQTSTSCNPLNATCADDAALGTNFTETFSASTTEFNTNLWNVTSGSDLITFSDLGAALTIKEKGDSVTVISDFYIFWGRTDFLMKCANGTGIVSTAILLSDDLDEIDWEILGGNKTTVENNWYGWGNTSQYNAEYETLADAQDGFHNYSVNWNSERLEYIIDDTVRRTVDYAEPGKYPQTPMRVRFGIWDAGDSSSAGTVSWAGGATDFSDAPFTMYIQSITVVDGTTNASSYAYSGHSGSYKDIVVTTGESAAYKVLNKESTAKKAEAAWSGLSKTAKIAVACGSLGGVAILAIAFTAYCIVQRKRGRAEKAIADREWDKHTTELLEYKRMMARGDFAINHMGHGEQRF